MDKSLVLDSARQFSTKYNPEGLVPFPFVEVISIIDGLELTYLETSNSEISGAIYLQKGIYQIIINSSKPPKRQYFTLAHEIAHYCIHKEYLKDETVPGFIDFGSLDSASSLLRPDTMPIDKDALQREREANTFAAELIMPEQKVREFYGLSEDVKDTAEAFRVSVPAMAVRLEKLGLV